MAMRNKSNIQEIRFNSFPKDITTLIDDIKANFESVTKITSSLEVNNIKCTEISTKSLIELEKKKITNKKRL